jgi:hypothetical protein
VPFGSINASTLVQGEVVPAAVAEQLVVQPGDDAARPEQGEVARQADSSRRESGRTQLR